MQIFRSTERDSQENRALEKYMLKMPLTYDRMTQKEKEFYVHKQLTLFARFGLGGCSETPLNYTEFDALMKLAKGDKFPNSEYEKWIFELLETHFPKAFENRKKEGDKWNCLTYFLGAHNKEVTSTPAIKSEIKLCLARRCQVLQIKKRSEIEKPDIKNIILLKSKFGDDMHRIGLIRFLDGTEEQVFLDFLPRARVGSRIVAHWSIACALLE